MITNKDISIENGNIILNGDKYPLDGQSPEAIMGIVKDNSDTTPTENSTAPITSGGVYTAISNKVKRVQTQTKRYNFTVANTFEYTGVSVACPTGHTYLIRAIVAYSNSEPKGIAASVSSTTMRLYENLAFSETSNTIMFMLLEGETAYIWAKGASALGDDIIVDIIEATT